MLHHETKGQPVVKDESVIVEAYGFRKYPKLIEQVMSDKPVVRRNALATLCDEMHNPLSVQGCVDAGMVQVLNSYIARSADPETKERASRALALAAVDANGRRSMLEQRTADDIAGALDDDIVNVRRNVLEALMQFSRGTIPCLKSIVGARYPSTLVGRAARELPEVQPLVLKLIASCARDERGLEDALGAGAVRVCIKLLASESPEVVAEAAATLSFLCFAEAAKHDAIGGGAIPPLVGLLSHPIGEVKAAAVAALMAITTTDNGKLELVPAQGIAPLMDLLADSQLDRIAQLNTLKTIANAVVHPIARETMKDDPRVLPILDKLELSRDKLIAKHAAIAKAAVLWEP